MRQKPGTRTSSGEKVVKGIRRATRKQFSAEEKIRIVLDDLNGEDSIAEIHLVRVSILDHQLRTATRTNGRFLCRNAA